MGLDTQAEYLVAVKGNAFQGKGCDPIKYVVFFPPHLGVEVDEKLNISSVKAHAEACGLRVGHRVRKVQGQPVLTHAEYLTAVKGNAGQGKGCAPIKLVVFFPPPEVVSPDILTEKIEAAAKAAEDAGIDEDEKEDDGSDVDSDEDYVPKETISIPYPSLAYNGERVWIYYLDQYGKEVGPCTPDEFLAIGNKKTFVWMQGQRVWGQVETMPDFLAWLRANQWYVVNAGTGCHEGPLSWPMIEKRSDFGKKLLVWCRLMRNSDHLTLDDWAQVADIDRYEE